MTSDLGYLYRLSFGECDETWWRYPILKVTPKTVIVGGWHDETIRLNRQALETKGEAWNGRHSYRTEAAKAASTSSYTNAPIHDVPYDPTMVTNPPESELSDADKEWAEALCRVYFAKNPNGTVTACQSHLLLGHDLWVSRQFIQRLGLAQKKKPVPVDLERRAALDAFVAAIQAGHPDSHICYEEGPKWWRIVEQTNKDGRRDVYGFVRREDGAIFQAVGWKSPARDTGILGFLDNYDLELLGKYSVVTEAGQRWRRLNKVAKH